MTIYRNTGISFQCPHQYDIMTIIFLLRFKTLPNPILLPLSSKCLIFCKFQIKKSIKKILQKQPPIYIPFLRRERNYDVKHNLL